MRRRLLKERLVQNEVGLLESGVDVANRCLLARFRIPGNSTGGDFLQVLRCPLHPLDPAADGEHVARGARVGAAGPQAVDRVDDERKPFQLDVDLLDGLCGDRLVYRGHRENRLAFEHRLVGQAGRPVFGLLCSGRIRVRPYDRQFVSGQDGGDAAHRECRTRVDVPNASMRLRTEQLFAEQHPLRAKVLGVLRPSRHLRHEVGRLVVLPDQLVVRHGSRSSCTPPHASSN